MYTCVIVIVIVVVVVVVIAAVKCLKSNLFHVIPTQRRSRAVSKLCDFVVVTFQVADWYYVDDNSVCAIRDDRDDIAEYIAVIGQSSVDRKQRRCRR